MNGGELLKVFVYTLIAVSLFSLVILILDSMAFGALLLNADSALTLRQELLISDPTSAVPTFEGSNTGDETVSTDNNQLNTSIDTAYKREMTRRTLDRNLPMPLITLARTCRVPDGNYRSTDRESAFYNKIDLFPLYVKCALRKSIPV